MGLGVWCSPAGANRAAEFGAGRRTIARDTALVFASTRARFRPRQRNKALAGALDRLVSQRKLSSNPARIDRQHQTTNEKRNSRWRLTLGDYPSNRDSYRPKENSESLHNRTGYRNRANANATLAG